MTGGWGRRGKSSSGYHDETEIFQDGRWKNVGKLPMLRTRLSCATLGNTVFVTGMLTFSHLLK